MRLVAHERVMADAVVRRQAVTRSARVVRLETRYGPDGVKLLAAAMATVVLGELVGIAGIAVLLASMIAGWVLIGLGAALLAASTIRFRQGIRAGHDHRQSRLD